jgi:hypothetical protein
VGDVGDEGDVGDVGDVGDEGDVGVERVTWVLVHACFARPVSLALPRNSRRVFAIPYPVTLHGYKTRGV